MKLDAIYHGNNVDVLAEFPDACIDLTVTSPPYDDMDLEYNPIPKDGLRKYNGYAWDFKGLVNQLYRVTKPGGVMVWVVGDATIDGSETGTSFRQALYFKEIGFNLHDTMIYNKGGAGGAKGSTLAYWQAFEFMFVFSKDRPKSVNLIEDKENKYGGQKSGSYGRTNRDGTRETYGVGKVIKVLGKRTNVWDISCGKGKSATEDYIFQHPAIFPEALARDHILSWSNPGDVVLDPFVGSGTTCKMAKETGRRWIGIDISAEYCRLAERRVAGANVPLFTL